MLARYFLFHTGTDWAVTLEGRIMGRYASRTEAIEAAIVMADLMGAMHHDADVMVAKRSGLELVWTYGADRVARRSRKASRRLQKPPPRVVQVQRGAQPA